MQRRLLSSRRVFAVVALCFGSWIHAAGQTSSQSTPGSQPAHSAKPAQVRPDAPAAPGSQATPSLRQHAPQTPEEIEAARIAALGTINGVKYDQPSHKDQFLDYLHDSYGLPAFARTGVRSLYEEGLDKPKGWGQDFPGFMQRVGSNAAITAIDGNVRLGMETLFREDMRYIPCHGCSIRRKIQNALLSEVTARHDVDGHRFFTLTPAIADFSGPIIANSTWYPNHDPFGGVVATRTVAATRVGAHLFTEFVLERRHHDRKIEDSEPLRVPPKPDATASH
jgi:hypothetical protein